MPPGQLQPEIGGSRQPSSTRGSQEILVQLGISIIPAGEVCCCCHAPDLHIGHVVGLQRSSQWDPSVLPHLRQKTGSVAKRPVPYLLPSHFSANSSQPQGQLQIHGDRFLGGFWVFYHHGHGADERTCGWFPSHQNIHRESDQRKRHKTCDVQHAWIQHRSQWSVPLRRCGWHGVHHRVWWFLWSNRCRCRKEEGKACQSALENTANWLNRWKQDGKGQVAKVPRLFCEVSSNIAATCNRNACVMESCLPIVPGWPHMSQYCRSTTQMLCVYQSVGPHIYCIHFLGWWKFEKAEHICNVWRASGLCTVIHLLRAWARQVLASLGIGYFNWSTGFGVFDESCFLYTAVRQTAPTEAENKTLMRVTCSHPGGRRTVWKCGNFTPKPTKKKFLTSGPARSQNPVLPFTEQCCIFTTTFDILWHLQYVFPLAAGNTAVRIHPDLSINWFKESLQKRSSRNNGAATDRGKAPSSSKWQSHFLGIWPRLCRNSGWIRPIFCVFGYCMCCYALST